MYVCSAHRWKAASFVAARDWTLEPRCACGLLASISSAAISTSRQPAASLAGRIGEMFDAIVTGASDKGVYVRTVDGIEGRVMRGHHGLAQDQQVRLMLVRADATHGFIDFENPAGIEPRKVERAER